MNDALVIPDLLEGVPHPGGFHPLVGHEKILEQILGAYAGAKLHHAIMLSGPKGIGKATLAFRVAAHLFSHAKGRGAPTGLDRPDPDNPDFAKIAAGAHPNLLHIARPWDQKTKKFKTRLTVDEVRKTVSFFGTARAEEGWRVAIIDAMDDTNINAANALLKVLEEPPQRTLFFIISHAPATVLPTVRSRCLHLPMQGLSEAEVIDVLSKIDVFAEINPQDRDLLVKLSSGSVRQAILLAREGGVELYKTFHEICQQPKSMDWDKIHTLADAISARGKEDRYRLFFSFADRYIEENATGRNGLEEDISTLARWAEVWEKTRNSLRIADAYNLDRKQVILNLFDDLGAAACG